MLTKLLSRKTLLLMTRINVPQTLRNLPSSLRRLANPNNLNIHLVRSENPEDLLLRQFRLQREIHTTSRMSRTSLRTLTTPTQPANPHHTPSRKQGRQ